MPPPFRLFDPGSSLFPIRFPVSSLSLLPLSSSHILPLGLSDTGRMLSALSDSYLPGMMEQSLDFNMEPDGGRRILSPEEMLMPPLSMQDRHPSAPQLASMLASSVDNKMASDNMAVTFEDVRECSYGMLSNLALYIVGGEGRRVHLGTPV